MQKKAKKVVFSWFPTLFSPFVTTNKTFFRTKLMTAGTDFSHSETVEVASRSFVIIIGQKKALLKIAIWKRKSQGNDDETLQKYLKFTNHAVFRCKTGHFGLPFGSYCIARTAILHCNMTQTAEQKGLRWSGKC